MQNYFCPIRSHPIPAVVSELAQVETARSGHPELPREFKANMRPCLKINKCSLRVTKVSALGGHGGKPNSESQGRWICFFFFSRYRSGHMCAAPTG